MAPIRITPKKSYTDQLLPDGKENKPQDTAVHRAFDRGYADHGWLKARHSFSFASWYDPNRIQFGALRVLNDDQIDPSQGFGTHPHDNMEIITIPLKGGVRHQDSMGNSGVVEEGEIQVMSAGQGILHSEFNAHNDQSLELFQIWIFPNRRNVEPRYAQRAINLSTRNEFVELVGPKTDAYATWIYQDAFISMGAFDGETAVSYPRKRDAHGIYLMVVKGQISIRGEQLNKRDAIAISDREDVEILAMEDSKILVLEVPMDI